MQYNEGNGSGCDQAKINLITFNIKKSINSELWLQIRVHNSCKPGENRILYTF